MDDNTCIHCFIRRSIKRSRICNYRITEETDCPFKNWDVAEKRCKFYETNQKDTDPEFQEFIGFIKHLYDRLGVMWDNRDSRVKKTSDNFGSFRIFEDELIQLVVDSCNYYRFNLIGFASDKNRKFTICNFYYYYPYCNNKSIDWNVSDECKRKVINYINEEILNGVKYETLEKQFCKRLK